MNDKPATATIELLTAEVRTLQVGSRQVTLSVYRQLDKLKTPAYFEAFGRVRDGRADSDELQLVGRDTRSGALVACELLPMNWRIAHRSSQDFRCWIGSAGTHLSTRRLSEYSSAVAYEVAGEDPQTLLWDLRKTEPCPHGGHAGDNVTELEARWRDRAKNQHRVFVQYEEEFRNLNDLPLIVLAGLR